MKKTILCGLLLPITTLVFIACSGNSNLTNQLKGSWIAPINGMPEQMEGFELKDDGLLLPSIWRHWFMRSGRPLKWIIQMPWSFREKYR